MEALILSCSTGGGHNCAGLAIKEELEKRGHNAVMIDPYSLVGRNLDKKVGNCYVTIAQRSPRLFGVIYKMGDVYRKFPFHSPVYDVNKLMRRKMEKYLSSHSFDVILMPHVFPGEILTYMKDRGLTVPKLIFISTDYTCIPFTEETKCDYYITSSQELVGEYIFRGIERDKLVHAGIPVRGDFNKDITCEQAKATLGLDIDKKYLLLSGGSMGAGIIEQSIVEIKKFLDKNLDYRLIVACGSNAKLMKKLQAKYGDCVLIKLISSTDKFAYYLKACEVFISKPGGLSSTEAAVTNTPLIHIAPIPGCEDKNMKFFSDHNMSIAVGNNLSKLIPAIIKATEPQFREEMIKSQKEYINPNAAKDICDLAEKITNNKI